MRHVERRILARAVGVTAASGPYLDNALILAGPKPCKVIYNGLVDEVQPVQRTRNERFTMLYTGRIYKEQNWNAVVTALNDLLAEMPDLSSQFVLELYSYTAGNEPNIRALVEFGKRTGLVQFRQAVSRGDLPQLGGRADALLSVVCEENVGQVALKLVDYMTWGPRILLLGQTIGVQHDLINRTRTGVAVRDHGELTTWLKNALRDRRNGKLYDGHPMNDGIKELNIDVQMTEWENFIVELSGSGRADR
jgi:glycosyltransferase involved in cell wall biosynthesis